MSLPVGAPPHHLARAQTAPLPQGRWSDSSKQHVHSLPPSCGLAGQANVTLTLHGTLILLSISARATPTHGADRLHLPLSLAACTLLHRHR